MTRLKATRVGVHCPPLPGRWPKATCVRCGRARAVHPKRHAELCGDCKAVDPRFGQERF